MDLAPVIGMNFIRYKISYISPVREEFKRNPWMSFDSATGHVVAPLDKTLFYDYLLGGFEQAANSVDENLKKSA